MSYKTIAFLYPGAMGASLAWTLHTRIPGLTLLTSLGSRSEATRARATEVGLTDVPLDELVDRSDIIEGDKVVLLRSMPTWIAHLLEPRR